MKEVVRLTDLEIKVMNVLWEYDTAMTIQEISGKLEKEKISMPSVKQCIRYLLAKKAVRVCESVLVGTVYARTFRACFSQEEFLMSEYMRLQKSVYGGKKKNPASIVVAMMCNNEENDVSVEEVEHLQAYIDEKKKQIDKKK